MEIKKISYDNHFLDVMRQIIRQCEEEKSEYYFGNVVLYDGNKQYYVEMDVKVKKTKDEDEELLPAREVEK